MRVMSYFFKNVHWTKALESGTNRQTSKTHFRDGSVNDSPFTELIHKAFCDLNVMLLVLCFVAVKGDTTWYAPL